MINVCTISTYICYFVFSSRNTSLKGVFLLTIELSVNEAANGDNELDEALRSSGNFTRVGRERHFKLLIR